MTKRTKFCDNCIHSNETWVGPHKKVRHCRINPPKKDGWPVVQSFDWCSKHEENPDFVAPPKPVVAMSAKHPPVNEYEDWSQA